MRCLKSLANRRQPPPRCREDMVADRLKLQLTLDEELVAIAGEELGSLGGDGGEVGKDGSRKSSEEEKDTHCLGRGQQSSRRGVVGN